jgi:hypothetical protein
MNPALAATGSSGLAAAFVVLLNALLRHFGLGVDDPNVEAAEITVVTAACGVGAHYLTREPPTPVVPAAPPAQ